MPSLPAREDILLASSELFAEHGFKGTTTRMIAERVGIRQPSLFHHFARKADILEALVDAGGRQVRSYVERVDFGGEPRIELYRLIVSDCLFLLTEPLRINKLMALPELQQGPLGLKVAATREQIIDSYRRLIVAGAQAGHFLLPDVEVATHAIFSMGESLWFSNTGRDHVDPGQLACAVADMALRALLIDVQGLEGVRDAATAARPAR